MLQVSIHTEHTTYEDAICIHILVSHLLIKQWSEKVYCIIDIAFDFATIFSLYLF